MNSPYIRSELAKAALRHVPSIIRNDLLAEPVFSEEYSLGDATVLSFGELGVSLRRLDLFDSVRIALSDTTISEVADVEGRIWQVKNNSKGRDLPKLELTRDGHGFIIPDLSVLSPDVDIRLRFLNEMIADLNLPVVPSEMWKSILIDRGLTDFEVDLFFSDFRETPIDVARSIRNEVVHKRIETSTLIPLSRRYYERLVGVYDGSANISEYAIKNCQILFNQLTGWQAKEGLLFSLLLASHASISDQIDISQLSGNEFIEVLIFLEKSGDRISQLGAVEVGLRVVQSKPEIKPYLVQLVQQILDDKAEQPNSGFKLMSALFFLVDGELSKARLFSATPPFYRRLVAFTQASLIQRQILNSGIDIEDFCKWAVNQGGMHFYIQNLVDMRLGPRWNPDLAVSAQIKADFCGRLMNSARKHGQESEDNELFNQIYEQCA